MAIAIVVSFRIATNAAMSSSQITRMPRGSMPDEGAGVGTVTDPVVSGAAIDWLLAVVG